MLGQLALETIEATVRDLAREFPERQADNKYLVNGEPCCIFGHALQRLGVLGFYGIDEDSDDQIDVELGIRNTPAGEWFNSVQSYQDEQYTWEQAVTFADERHGRG